MSSEPSTPAVSKADLALWGGTIAVLLLILQLHLLSGLLAALLVYELVHLLAERLRVSAIGRDNAKVVAVAMITGVVVILLALVIFGAVSALRHGNDSLPALLGKLAEILDNSRQRLPDSINDYLPADADELREKLTGWLRAHSGAVGGAGMIAGRVSAHILIGMVIGALLALRKGGQAPERAPLAAAIIGQAANVSSAFRRVVFAQAWIAAINAGFTTVYLMAILPLCGVHLPLTKTMVTLTLFAGLLPIIGNLISNSVIVIVSLSASLPVAGASLVFLIAVHKLEYFLNARIIGSHIRSQAWELLLAMVMMEAAFGIAGVIAAPIYYAYLKHELAEKGWSEPLRLTTFRLKMTELDQDGAGDDIPSGVDFAGQLIRQVLGDLDGVLLDAGAPTADAFTLLGAAAAAGRTRGGVLTLLASAALSAHQALVDGRDGDFATAAEAEVGELLQRLAGAEASQLPRLHGAARTIEAYVAAAEPGAPPPAQTLALAIYRLYEGLRNEDEALGGRGLVELRALTVHLDATAAMLDLGSVSAEPLRVIRPDRFHDYFFRFTSLAQTQNAEGEERAVAALSRDGRIEALITEGKVHPIVIAAKQVHDAVSGDTATKDHVLARIRALLVFLAQLRQTPSELLGDPAQDPEAHIALVIGAATAPLRRGADFEFAALAQVARYNRTLLRAAQPRQARTH